VPYTKEDLKIMQSWPLERKIAVTQTRIMEWYSRFDGKAMVSFSGGKDSTVLLDLARRCYPDIEAVYVDTGLEYPEVRRFARSCENVTVLKPEMNFKEVLDKYGWCYPSKDVAESVHYARQGGAWALRNFNGKNMDGTNSGYRDSRYKPWAYLVDSPFKISHKCCEVMKVSPLLKYARKSGKTEIIGTLATESHRRKQTWLTMGCNAFDAKRPTSKPMSFWTEQDVLRYLRDFKIPYASVYGEIVEDKKRRLSTTGVARTGCVFCPIGCHLDRENRFEKLKGTHPKLYDYCIHDLGLGRFWIMWG